MMCSRVGLVSYALLLGLTACDTTGSTRASSDLDPASPQYIDLSTLSQSGAALVGTWDWAASVSYYTADGQPSVSTPESTGRTETWTFRADGTVTRAENGEAVFESTYQVVRRSYGNGTRDERASLQFGDGGYGEDFGTDRDLLVLDSTPVDGPQARYQRR